MDTGEQPRQGGDAVEHPITWDPSLTFLKAAIGFILAGNAIFAFGVLLFSEGQVVRAATALVFLMVGVGAWIMLARGRVRVAVWLLFIGVWLVLTAAAYFNNGVRSTAIVFYPLVITLAGWMVSTRAAMWCALATSAVTFGLVLGELQGLLPDSPPLTPVLRWVMLSFVFVFSAFLIGYFVGNYRMRLAEVSRLGRELAQRNDEVSRLNVTLEERVRERTAQLQAVNQELENFSYTLSHDLRTPLRSMVGFSGLLAESAGAKLDDESRGYLRRIAASGTRMSRLVDGVLEYTRLTRIEMVLRQVDLDAIVAETVEELGMRRPDIEWVTGRLGMVRADPVMIRMIFRHLIDNALKFASGERRLRIEIGAESVDGVRWFFVRDNGIGFDMKHAEHLFSLFTRLHNDPEIDSTGAGLAIVKRLVERHGGAIHAEAAPGQGATFRFHL